METRCPFCRSIFGVSNEYVGELAECPMCKQEFIIRNIAENSKPRLTPLQKSKSKTKSQVVASVLGIAMVITGIIIIVYDLFDGMSVFAFFLIIIGSILSLSYFCKSIPDKHCHIICPNPLCGYNGDATPENTSNWGLICILLFLGLIPGLLYAIYSGGRNKVICPKCGVRIR